MTPDPISFIKNHTVVTSPPAVPEISLHLAPEGSPLWQLTEERLSRESLPPPYWGFAWPGGQAMARYILDHPECVRNKRVLDFASGCGIAAIAAKKAGAKKVMAVDIDLLALEAIRMNAISNNVQISVRDKLDMSKAYTKTDVLFAADIFYEQSTSTTVIRWLRLCVEAGVKVFIADPGRAYVPEEGMLNLVSYEIPTSSCIESNSIRRTIVWSLNKV